MTECRGRSLGSSDRPPHKGNRQLPKRRGGVNRAEADVMDDIEADLFMKFGGLEIG